MATAALSGPARAMALRTGSAPAAATAAPCSAAILAVLALLLAALPSRAIAAESIARSGQVDGSQAPATCWEQAAQRQRVNPHLLVAIAEVESGLQPQAIGRNANGSLDIGLMQINTLWLPELRRHGITARDLLDPCVSVHVGAWVLAQKMQRHGNTWVAVGAYNAGSAALRERYARKVVEALARRGVIGGGQDPE